MKKKKEYMPFYGWVILSIVFVSLLTLGSFAYDKANQEAIAKAELEKIAHQAKMEKIEKRLAELRSDYQYNNSAWGKFFNELKDVPLTSR